MKSKYIKLSKIVTCVLSATLIGSVGAVVLLGTEQSLANMNKKNEAETNSLVVSDKSDVMPNITLDAINPELYIDRDAKELYKLCTDKKSMDIDSNSIIDLSNDCALVALNKCNLGVFSDDECKSVFLTIDTDGIGYDILASENVKLDDLAHTLTNKVDDYAREFGKTALDYKTYLGLAGAVFNPKWCYEYNIDDATDQFDTQPIEGYITYDDKTVKFNTRSKDYSLDSLEDDVLCLLGNDKAHKCKEY